VRAVIFDIDGTLTNTKKVEDKCFMTAFLQTFDVNIFNQDWADLNHVTDWGITEELVNIHLNREPTADEYKLMINNFILELQSELVKDCKQFDEVKGSNHFFNFIKTQTDWKLGIATGSWEKSALLKLNAIGLDISNIAFSNSDQFKSREEITKNVIDQLVPSENIHEHDIIYFGDGIWDFKACKNLGINFIGIDILGDDRLKNIGAKIVFKDYSDINQIINSINDRQG
jgi:phosphoglycolate phosphatase-like HAD superfamily hydrolase